jgi:hypothetical protein
VHGAEGESWTDGGDGREDRPRDAERRPADEDRVYGITTAETSHMQEITRRQKQYILTMLVRVVSIIVVVVVPGISWPVKIGLCLVATIIPYVAVVRANGGLNQEKDPTNLMLGPRHGELGPADRGLPEAGERQDFIVGERVYRDADETPEPPRAPQDRSAERVSQDPTTPGADGEAAGRGPVTHGQVPGEGSNGAPFGAGRPGVPSTQGSEQQRSA